MFRKWFPLRIPVILRVTGCLIFSNFKSLVIVMLNCFSILIISQSSTSCHKKYTNSHVQYESPITYSKKVMAKFKVFVHVHTRTLTPTQTLVR